MENEDNLMMERVKDLRKAMGLTQVVFAVRIGKAHQTVQRYENVVPPKGPELATLVTLAREAGRPELALAFKQAAIASVPDELVQLIREGDIDETPGKKTANKGKVDKRRISA